MQEESFAVYRLHGNVASYFPPRYLSDFPSALSNIEPDLSNAAVNPVTQYLLESFRILSTEFSRHVPSDQLNFELQNRRAYYNATPLCTTSYTTDFQLARAPNQIESV